MRFELIPVKLSERARACRAFVAQTADPLPNV
jgi:hypothetical protein